MTLLQEYYKSPEYKRLWYLKNRTRVLLKTNLWREQNREEINKKKREHLARNKKCINAKRKIFREQNKEKLAKQKHKSYLRNKEKILQKQTIYNAKNRAKINIRKAKWSRERIKSNVEYKLQRNLRNRLWYILKRGEEKRKGSAVRDLGCTVAELKIYLEKQFKPGMTWKNYSYRGWHIDHKKPLMLFDLSDRKQFLKAFNYKNLQPLWMKENLSKSAKY